MWLPSSLFKLLKQSKAYLPTFVLTLGHCWCTFWSKNGQICFSTVIPGILLSFYERCHSWFLGKHTVKWTYLPFFLLGINRTSADMLWTAMRDKSAHEERRRGCRPARPIFRRGFGSPAASFIFVKTGSALGSCAHKVIFCYMLLTASAPPSSVFSELCQVLMKQWLHSHRWLWYLEDQGSQSRQNPEHEQNWIIGYFAHCQHFLKTFITLELFC